jgi:WD40 repeat protein
VRIYKYPILCEKAQCITLKAHKGPVSSVTFTSDNLHLITAGLNDGSIIVWEIN